MKWFTKMSLAVGVVSTLALSACGYLGGFFGNQSETIDMKKTLDAEEVQEITIDGELADIRIHTHHQNKILAEVTGSVSKHRVADLQADTSGKSATIKLSQNQTSPISLNWSEPKLNVYIPDKMYETLTLKTSLGDLTSDQTLLAKKINVRAVEGDVVLNGCQGEVLKGTVEFGNMTLQQLDASVDLQTEEGNVTVSPVTELKGHNQIQAEFGDANITLPQKPEVLTLDLRANFGEIHSDLSVDHSERNQNVLKGSIGRPTTHSPTLTVNADNGHISLTEIRN